MSIRREIEVTRKGLSRPIDVTYGTNILPIEFMITDFELPEGATAEVYAMGRSNKLVKQSCVISKNIISFIPEIGLFEEGKNVLQLAATYAGKDLFSFYIPVNCQKTMVYEGAQDLENDPTFVAIVMQMKEDIANKITTPEAAEVGQILEVEEVDENGKPTKFIAVDKPTGSGEGGAGAVELTQAEYDNLSEEDKMKDVIYFITDKDKLIYKGKDYGVADGGVNPNLLINGDFQVWQEGTSFSGVTALKYTAEMWKHHDCVDTVTKVSNGISLTGSNEVTLVQATEKNLTGEQYTMSVSIDGVECEPITFLVTGTWQAKDLMCNGVKIGAAAIQWVSSRKCTELEVYIHKASVVVNWVKLEQGTIATPFIPRLYGEELALCQRYHLIGEFTGVSMYHDNDKGYMFAFTVPQMRINTPTPKFIRGKYYSSGKLTTVNNPTHWWYMDETQDHTSSASVCLYVRLNGSSMDTICAGASIVAELDARFY